MGAERGPSGAQSKSNLSALGGGEVGALGASGEVGVGFSRRAILLTSTRRQTDPHLSLPLSAPKGAEREPGGAQSGCQCKSAGINNLLSVDFTVFQELTVSRDKTVGRFYNPGFGRFPLTIVIGLGARINPLGMGIA